MRLSKLAIATTLALALALPAARAQSPEPSEQATLVREGLASPYGKALIAELGKNLRSGADPACLSAKAISADQLKARSLELMTKWGTRVMETRDSLIDKKVYADKFAASAGPNAGAELEPLKQNADVKRYLAIAQRMRQAKILDSIFEQFDRYALISRIKLAPVSPLATGNEVLLRQNPADATEEKLERFIASSKSTALKRYLALSEKDAVAASASIKLEQPLWPVPSIFFKGVEADLSELCIATR